jgi:DNA-binding Lrp family transcriptional regulator
MEVAMNTTIESPAPSVLTDEKIVAALKKNGPLTIEEMSSIPGMSWVRVFSAVDRLSRSGVVSLHRIGLGYQVVYNKTILSQPIVFPKTLAATAETPLQRA